MSYHEQAEGFHTLSNISCPFVYPLELRLALLRIVLVSSADFEWQSRHITFKQSLSPNLSLGPRESLSSNKCLIFIFHQITNTVALSPGRKWHMALLHFKCSWFPSILDSLYRKEKRKNFFFVIYFFLCLCPFCFHFGSNVLGNCIVNNLKWFSHPL